MVGKTCVDQEEWSDINIDGFNFEEEEEALSLCDLPIDFISIESSKNDKEEAKKFIDDHDDDFEFGSSLIGNNSLTIKPSEMCAAEDVFFKGQILPSRHSVSETFLISQHYRIDSQGPSRTESMDRSCSTGSTSYSSRSSSYKSHYSSSSASTNSNKPRIRNNFLTHPSPKPQIRTSSTNRPPRIANPNNHRTSSASSMWDFFRFGLALGMLFTGGSCKCSVSTIEAIPLKSTTTTTTTAAAKSDHNARQTGTMPMIEKVEKLKHKQEMGTEDKKQNLSRIRTFEWIKQLSHASYNNNNNNNNDRQMLLSTKN
ncbi:hypothetical protein ACFE04_023351 [Oxalis oulophora]